MTGDNAGEATREDEFTQLGRGTFEPLVERQYDPASDGELATSIVFALADAADVPPTEVRAPALHDAVDVEALEAVFKSLHLSGGARQDAGVVEFHYEGYVVQVRSDGRIGVYELGG